MIKDTGKTSLLKRFVEGKFSDVNHTVGVEYGTNIVQVGGRLVKIQVC